MDGLNALVNVSEVIEEQGKRRLKMMNRRNMKKIKHYKVANITSGRGCRGHVFDPDKRRAVIEKLHTSPDMSLWCQVLGHGLGDFLRLLAAPV